MKENKNKQVNNYNKQITNQEPASEQISILENIDINKSTFRILSKLSSPTSIITTVWNKEIIGEFNDLMEKLVKSIIVNIETSTIIEIFNTTDFVNKLLPFDDDFLKLISTGFDNTIYYLILKNKYKNLDSFLEKVFNYYNALENNKKNKNKKIKLGTFFLGEEIHQLSEEEKSVFGFLVSLLPNEKITFEGINKSNLTQSFGKVFEKLFLGKDGLFSNYKLLEKKGLVFNKKDLLNLNKKSTDNIIKKLNKFYEQGKARVGEIKHKDFSTVVKTNNFNNIKNKIKENLGLNDRNYDKKKYGLYKDYVRYLILRDKNLYNLKKIKTYLFCLEKNFLNEKEWTKQVIKLDKENIKKLVNSLSEENRFDKQKRETLKSINNLFVVKELILKIEKTMWISPWLNTFVKQGLAYRTFMKDENVKLLKSVLYFVVSDNYQEYKNLKNFFDDVEVYQENKFLSKFLNTLSLLILSIIILLFLINYNPSYYNTLFFILIFVGVVFYTYFEYFDLKLKNIGFLISLIIVVAFIMIFTLGMWGFNILNIILFITIIFLLLLVFRSLNFRINTGIYNILVFIFMLFTLFGLSKYSDNILEKINDTSKGLLGNKISSILFENGKYKSFGKNNIAYSKLESLITNILEPSKSK